MEKLNYSNNIWYLDEKNDFDGAIYTYCESLGCECVVVDQYWANCGHGVEDIDKQISNIALVVNAPLMYETIYAYLKGNVDKDRLLKVLEKVNEDGITH